MTRQASTLNGRRSAYPPAVEALIPRARELAERIGRVPSRNLIMKEFRIGAPKAAAVIDALNASETTEATPVDLGPAEAPPVVQAPAEPAPEPQQEDDGHPGTPTPADRGRRFATVALGILAGIVASLGVLGVVVSAFSLSFDAIRFTAEAAHIRPALSWLFPVAVDGAMAVAVVAAVVLRRLGRSVVYPWGVVLFGALVSIVANALHAWAEGAEVIALPPAWAMTLSAVPPVLLALSVHLLVVLAQAVTDDVTPGGPAAR